MFYLGYLISSATLELMARFYEIIKGVIGLQECVVLLSGAHLRNAARADKMNTLGLVRVGNQGPGRYVYK